MTTLALNNLWTYLQGLPLSQKDRKWLADKLIMSKDNTSELTAEERKSRFLSLAGSWSDAEGEEYYQMINGIIEKAANAGFIGLLMMILALAVMPAICEELFFRVGLQQLLGKWFKNEHIAVVVTALIFSFMHLDMNGFLVRFVMGLVLGYVFVYSRSIVPNVMLHFLNNAVATISTYVVFRNGASIAAADQPWMLHWLPTTLCTIAALVLFWCCFVRKSNTVQQQSDGIDS